MKVKDTRIPKPVCFQSRKKRDVVVVQFLADTVCTVHEYTGDIKGYRPKARFTMGYGMTAQFELYDGGETLKLAEKRVKGRKKGLLKFVFAGTPATAYKPTYISIPAKHVRLPWERGQITGYDIAKRRADETDIQPSTSPLLKVEGVSDYLSIFPLHNDRQVVAKT